MSRVNGLWGMVRDRLLAHLAEGSATTGCRRRRNSALHSESVATLCAAR